MPIRWNTSGTLAQRGKFSHTNQVAPTASHAIERERWSRAMTMTAVSVGPQQYEKNYPPEHTSVREIRRDMTLALRTWGLDELIDDIAMVVSELMTNAILHTETPRIGASITRIGDQAVRLEVRDRSPEEPHAPRTGSTAESGRGIALVDALSSAWGWERIFGGKKVWAEVTG